MKFYPYEKGGVHTFFRGVVFMRLLEVLAILKGGGTKGFHSLKGGGQEKLYPVLRGGRKVSDPQFSLFVAPPRN